MYLHIGDDILVHTDEIVAILDKKLLDSSPIFARISTTKSRSNITFSQKVYKVHCCDN